MCFDFGFIVSYRNYCSWLFGRCVANKRKIFDTQKNKRRSTMTMETGLADCSSRVFGSGGHKDCVTCCKKQSNKWTFFRCRRIIIAYFWCGVRCRTRSSWLCDAAMGSILVRSDSIGFSFEHIKFCWCVCVLVESRLVSRAFALC